MMNKKKVHLNQHSTNNAIPKPFATDGDPSETSLIVTVMEKAVPDM